MYEFGFGNRNGVNGAGEGRLYIQLIDNSLRSRISSLCIRESRLGVGQIGRVVTRGFSFLKQRQAVIDNRQPVFSRCNFTR